MLRNVFVQSVLHYSGGEKIVCQEATLGPERDLTQQDFEI